MGFGEVRLATWYWHHEPGATTSKTPGNPAFGGEKLSADIVAIGLWPLRPRHVLRRVSKRFFYHHIGQY